MRVPTAPYTAPYAAPYTVPYQELLGELSIPHFRKEKPYTGVFSLQNINCSNSTVFIGRALCRALRRALCRALLGPASLRANRRLLWLRGHVAPKHY